MRSTLFSNLEKKDKRLKLASVLKRKTRGALDEKEITHILSKIDIGKQYVVYFTQDIKEFKEKSKLITDVEIDLVNGTKGKRNILRDVIFLDKNDINIGEYVNIIRFHNNDIVNYDKKDIETEFDESKKVCIITEFVYWNHIKTEFSRHHIINIYCPLEDEE